MVSDIRREVENFRGHTTLAFLSKWWERYYFVTEGRNFLKNALYLKNTSTGPTLYNQAYPWMLSTAFPGI